MLESIPEGLDKREGSVLYNALAPVAVELQNAYIQMDTILDMTYADTAEGIYLTKRCAERGIERLSATNAILKGEFNINVPIGSRFNLEGLNYLVNLFVVYKHFDIAVSERNAGKMLMTKRETVFHTKYEKNFIIITEKIEENTFRLQCETSGEEGNHYLGTLVPIEYIQGLVTAKLTEVLIPGEDTESDQSLRKRYYESLQGQAFGGNIADYKQKVEKLQGVGAVKVYPIWQGGGTVKLVILSSEYTVPTKELVEMVQTAVDPVQNQGEGLGIAPIGHVVTVVGAEETTIDIATNITYQTGYDFEKIKTAFEKTVDEYFRQLNENWEKEQIVVRISQIESRLLDLEGVLDVSDTAFNGEEKNIEIEADNIVTRGEVYGERG